MSFPVYRDIATIKASPILASHAPNLRNIIEVTVKVIIFIDRRSGTYRTSLSVTPSRASRDIRR